MKKNYCGIAQIILLLWFFLDMTGLYFEKNCLVTSSYKEDGLFFLIYLVSMICFFVKERIGKWLVIGWLSIWLVVQVLCHEWYTFFNTGIMGTAEGKIRYFSNTIHWLQIKERYVPDVYHTVLHLLILTALTLTIIYTIRNRKNHNFQFIK